MCPNCREDLTACRCDEADMLAERAAEDHYDLVLRPARDPSPGKDQVRSVREHQLRLVVDLEPHYSAHLIQWETEGRSDA